MSLLALFKRHGDKGLFDSLHLAIKRKHFQLLKYICEENETGEFKKLVTEGIAELKSSQNCLHAIIAIIATDPHYIDMVKTLVKCADTKAFATKRQADGNTPLHDFAMFTGKRFKIYESKSSKQRPSSFPDWVGDEKRYAEEYVTILRIMIQKCPSALWTLNNEGKTPYVVHRETRPLSINGERWDKLEYDATRLDGGSAVVIEEDQPQVSRVASNGFKNTEVENANPKKAVETAKLQRSNSLIPIPPKKEPQRAPREESSRSNGQEWVYSRYLAREIGKQLLDECCSLSSWDEARTGIFGRQLNNQSPIQTSLKMEDALYKGIENDHDFLKLNSILAYVELTLAKPTLESTLDSHALATTGLSPAEFIDPRRQSITPEQSVESIARMRKNLDIFKERIESQSEKSVDLEQQNKGQAKQTGKRTYGLKFDLPQNLSTGPYGPMKGDRGTRWEKVNERKAAKQNGKDKENLTKQIHDAGAAGISLFCSSDDIGVHTHTDQLLPSPSIRLKRIGSCNGNGTKSDFVGETNIHYLFPGEQLPVMQEHLERKGSNREGDQGGEDKGSSASTALAAGLAALVLWCTVKSGGDKSEFLNDRMYDLFDALKVDQARASLVDVSGLMDDIIRQDETAHESVSIFVEKLRKLSAPKTVLKGVGF
ncbi:hypothetical protein CEP52_014628 [Fusarium oligoseptatum]|uniref:Ankyrin repeat protein n=1 Tax=Fusarium oligoseptatum TaxID=2604345 RepID=A0A428SKD2_9HYPO|nr:hypothetical protein CEP52_014628 [Fusarium oligoseptatum]